jgi:hypothetical protein
VPHGSLASPSASTESSRPARRESQCRRGSGWSTRSAVPIAVCEVVPFVLENDCADAAQPFVLAG